MARPYCRCGHRFYKHGEYPLDYPFCKGKNLPKYDLNSCRCDEYNPLLNLELLEKLYVRSLDKNTSGRKV